MAMLALGPLNGCAVPLDCPTPTAGGEPALRFDGDPPVNLIAISIDTLRKDHLGRYGGGTDTPFLDRLLDESVALDDLRACASWTLPGMACSVTGKSTIDLGVEPLMLGIGATDELPGDLATLATHLGERDYRTVLVTASWLFSDNTALGNGFARADVMGDARADRVTDSAVAAAANLLDSDAPFYLHVHYRDPHAPYNPPDEAAGVGSDLGELDPRTKAGIQAIQHAWPDLSDDERSEVLADIERLYAGELRFMDTMIAELWADLEELGATDRALVVLWSDHGEQFYEHGDLQHAHSLYSEEADVFAAFWAQGLPAGTWDGPTLQQDLAPTILEALGVDPDDSHTGLPIGTAPEPRTRFAVTARNGDPPVMSAERGSKRLHYWWDGRQELYDLWEDPAETDDIFRKRDMDLRCMWQELTPELQRLDTSDVGPPSKAGL